MESLLFKHEIEISKGVEIVIPTVKDIIYNEFAYYGLVSMLTAMPIDMMVQLDDVGIDFTKIDEYELFLFMFEAMKSMNTEHVFKDLDLSKFVLAKNDDTGMKVLIDPSRDIVIDKGVHNLIADTLREIHGLEKNIKKPGNDEAKLFMLERARKKFEREKRKKHNSQLEELIVAMVNTQQYKYNFEQTLDLTILQFNKCVRQVVHKVDYENKMIGIYTGSISPKDISQDDLNWLVLKK